MADVDVYALQRSDLNGFLFATVGAEGSGMTLSVLSTLARAGLDPWEEAGRLAQLSRTGAIAALASLIAGMPDSLWSRAEAMVIATRLVALLPARGTRLSVAAAGRVHTQPRARRWMQSLIGRPGPRPPGQSAPQPNQRMSWPGAVMLALMALLLVGLTVGLLGAGTEQPGPAHRPSSLAASPAAPAPSQLALGQH